MAPPAANWIAPGARFVLDGRVYTIEYLLNSEVSTVEGRSFSRELVVSCPRLDPLPLWIYPGATLQRKGAPDDTITVNAVSGDALLLQGKSKVSLREAKEQWAPCWNAGTHLVRNRVERCVLTWVGSNQYTYTVAPCPRTERETRESMNADEFLASGWREVRSVPPRPPHWVSLTSTIRPRGTKPPLTVSFIDVRLRVVDVTDRDGCGGVGMIPFDVLETSWEVAVLNRFERDPVV